VVVEVEVIEEMEDLEGAMTWKLRVGTEMKILTIAVVATSTWYSMFRIGTNEVNLRVDVVIAMKKIVVGPEGGQRARNDGAGVATATAIAIESGIKVATIVAIMTEIVVEDNQYNSCK
jgi:hypothetical protein